MGIPAFSIMDGTNDPVHLIKREGNTFYLHSWEPSIIQPKGGGVWQDSPIADGRELVDRYYGNAIETFELGIADVEPDALYWEIQNLRRYLESAVGYWRNRTSNAAPVYLRRKAACESGYLYAHIYNWSTPNDKNPFSNPFLQSGGKAVFDRWVLTIERGDWRSVVPGTDQCIEVTQIKSVPSAAVTVVEEPTHSGDDWYTSSVADGVNIANVVLRFGSPTGGGQEVYGYKTYIVFDPVAIPAGSTIFRAYIEGVASNNDSGDFNLRIFGQDIDDAPAYSSKGESAARERTATYVDWGTLGYKQIPAWAPDEVVRTPDITSIIQEIVDRDGWANNQALCVIFEDIDSASFRRWHSFDNVSGKTSPQLTVVYSATTIDVGRAKTCLKEGYVANKTARSYLTDIYRYDDAPAPTFSPNLVNETAFALYPNPVADQDMAYFGIDSSVPFYGPFDNVIFDIGNEAEFTDDAYIAWEYSQGAASWAALICTDKTSSFSIADGYAFGRPGVNGVHFEPPDDWAVDTVNGVTGLWIRAVANIPVAPGDSITTPTQQNRYVYTCNWPYIKIEAGEVDGEMPAVARLVLANESDNRGDQDPKLWSSWIFLGLRSLARGANFDAYINMSDQQVIPGINVYNEDGVSTFEDDLFQATGRSIEWDPLVTTALTQIATISFDPEMSTQYFGRYRLFIRAKQTNGAVGTGAALQVLIPSTTNPLFTSEVKYIQSTFGNQILDFGEIVFPGGQDSQFTAATSDIVIKGLTVGATTQIKIQDTILMPIDEWSGDFRDLLQETVSRNGWVGNSFSAQQQIEIDSSSNPRKFIESRVHIRQNGRQVIRWRTVSNGPFQLAAKTAQKLWVFCRRNNDQTGTIFEAEESSVHKVQMFGAFRYFGGRGAG